MGHEETCPGEREKQANLFMSGGLARGTCPTVLALEADLPVRTPSDGTPRPRTALGRRAALRKAVHDQLLATGFSQTPSGYMVSGDMTKQRVRDLHSTQRHDNIERNKPFVRTYGAELMRHFAAGNRVDPAAVEPELVEVVAGTLESRLFRFACLLWSIPVSQGFGRRVRFLVRDRQNGCLIGLFALGDPVFNLSARDKWIGWTSEDRRERLTHVMDAYVLGSVPPYSLLLGGKLVASLIGSREVSDAYEQKYLGKRSVIAKKTNRARLVLLTTTSALGRSSIYNRLSIPDGPQFIRVGATRGFGHFHISGALFEELRGYLADSGHAYATGNRFGMGPNWKLRVVREALDSLGLDGNAVLRHGIEREVYAIPLAEDCKAILLGNKRTVHPCTLPAEQIAEYCRARWMIPRASRDNRYMDFDTSTILRSLLDGGPGPTW